MEISLSFYISEIPLFDTLTVEESKILEKHMLYKELEPDTLVYKEGSHGSSVCFVAEGKLQVIKRNKSGQEAIIATLEKGQSVGEMAIIDGLTRSASVKALTRAKVIILKREDFNKVIDENADIAIKILKELARSLSITLRDRSADITRLMLG